MKFRTAIYLALAAILASTTFSAPAFADKDHGKHGKKKDKHWDNDDHDRGHDRDDDDREYRTYNTKVLKVYLESDRHHGHDHGHHMKRYYVGDRVRESEILVLPPTIIRELRPVRGYRYVRVNDEIALISETTQNIVDLISLYSN